MKHIIHMSDLHIGFADFGERFGQLIERLKFEKGDNASQYVVIISGDLVDDANHQESYHEVKLGLECLKDAGFKDILVVPGNHDYGNGDKGDKKFVSLFQQTFYGDDQGYPRKDIIDGIAFIGLDSMAEELHWYDKLFAEGELGDEQLQRLYDILKSEEVRACKKRVVYLHHHPFDWRPLHQLKDSDKLKNALIGIMSQGISIDAILYGHNHEGKAHNGKWGILRCYDAGTATLRPRPKYLDKSPWFQVKSSTRVIDLEKDVQSDYELPLL